MQFSNSQVDQEVVVEQDIKAEQSARCFADTARVAPSSTAYLFVFLEIFEREGGIQSYVQDIFRSYSSFSEQSADVFLLRDGQDCANPFPSDRLNFHYFKHQSAQLGRLRMAIALFFHILKNRPQRVFCGHVNLAPLVRLLCQPFQIPYTVMVHGKEVWEPLPRALRIALQQADEIWTVSRYSRDRASASNQLDPGKIRLMPCAVDGDRFTPGEKSAALVERYGLMDAKVMVTVARLWSGDIYKGVDMTIRALGAIAQSIPNVKYLVIGRGDDQPRLAQLTKDLGVGDRVVFAGFVPTADLPEHYRLADAYVMPSQEGFGIVYLEAMACGVPVLAGDADGSADPLQDGKLGWRVPHQDVGAIAPACIEMLQQRAMPQGRSDGQWLRQQALDLFGKAAFTQRLRDALKQ
jgi:glycosyltransferase involved in cell wall biosynthesis